MKCPHCQAENRDGAEFCGDCGKTLRSSETVCPKCGTVNPQGKRFCDKCGHALTEQPTTPSSVTPAIPKTVPSPLPTSFANGRYQVKKFLGEGGKKKVYLAHDTTLDRDVAFALIKTEKLDEAGRTRIKREAQAMGRLGDHPNIVTVFDFGDHEGQPYMVLPLLPGGDVEGLIEKAPEHRLPLDKTLEIAVEVSRGLEFAHSKGIVHRDLKPGNVWLTAGGIAQIGDFGLAVAVDLSRLTADGMMVGTVSYMPPEQAMGGKVTAKADLYSLGAMLYEMVTGRPPFVGDDSVAIIGQHINTPPVSPTWHRADLPPAFETLILQLLEKDPEKRPQSATVVLQALESIEKGKAKKEPSKESTAPTENPLYRKVFVGREPELKQLQSAFDGAMSGQGALMMVSGEPGIGKTSLCEQLATYVTLRGGKTLVGHCYEEGSLSLPYLAFIEAMRSYVLDRPVDDLRKELGSGASDVARIVSEIREKLRVEPRAAEHPEEDRYRLLQSVTGFLTNAAAIQPLVIVLEDLHDADKGTLDMLTHVSRHLAGSRLLIVGTYRDVEVDRSHPLSAALADLRRVSNFGRVTLKGLNADEVRRMLESITRESVPWGLAEAIHRQTEGNPLFVQEVIRHLSEEGLLVHEGGKWKSTRDTPLEMSIPEGLRDVIGKRLSFLSSNTNEMLSVAAVIGREFQLDTLRGVVAIDEIVFVKSLKEAVQVSVLEERSQVGQLRYRFTHALFRQILYDEMIAPQRLSLHQQVARSLEAQYANRLEEHAVELAEHFSQSTDRADLAKAVSYGDMAAKRATAVYAFGEAVRMLRQSLKIQKVLDPADKEKQCELLLNLSQALVDAGEPRRALDVELPEALTLAEAIGDHQRAAQACVQAGLALFRYGQGRALDRESAPWIESLDRHAQPDTIERVWADYRKLYRERSKASYVENAAGRYRKLIGQSRVFRDEELFRTLIAAFSSGLNLSAEEVLPLAEEVATFPIDRAKSTAAGIFLRYGKRNRFEEMLHLQKAQVERSGQVNEVIQAMGGEVAIALLDGRLEDAIARIDSLTAYAREVNLEEYAWTAIVWRGLAPHVYMGKSVDYLENTLKKLLQEETSESTHSIIPLILAQLGKVPETTERLDRMLASRPHLDSVDDAIPLNIDVAYLEAAVLTKHHQAAERLLIRLTSQNTSNQLSGLGMTCVARHLGAAAAMLGRYDEARKHYQEAIKVTTEMRFRPELALSRLELAELLLEHYPKEKKEALEHLDFAIKEFREMKMQPSLERALRHKNILKA